MKRPAIIFGAAVFTVAALTLHYAQAGRVGGPARQSGTVAAFASVYVDVPLAVGPATIAVRGNGQLALGLVLYDGNGNMTYGQGGLSRKTVRTYVNQAGYFRIEVRNLSSQPSPFLLATN